MIPVPSHLAKFVVPLSEDEEREYKERMICKGNEDDLIARIICPCGNDAFELLYPGQTHIWENEEIPCCAEVDGDYFLIIKSRCNKCKKEHLIYDADFHGWNGWICHDEKQASIQRPILTEWKCSTCKNDIYKMIVKVSSQGKEDFIQETDGQFEIDKWQDAFECLSIDITCCNCGKENQSFILCEAM